MIYDQHVTMKEVSVASFEHLELFKVFINATVRMCIVNIVCYKFWFSFTYVWYLQALSKTEL